MKGKIKFLNKIISFLLTIILIYVTFGRDVSAVEKIENQILYLNVEITKEENEKYKLEINETDIKDGYVKPNFNNNDNLSWEKIKCSLLDENKEIIDIKLADNPLIESSDILLDNGKLKNLTNNKDNGVAYIKANYDKRIQFIKIETKSETGELIDLGTIGIKDKKSNKSVLNIEPKFNVTKVIDGGSDEECLNFVIMGDGFTASEQGKFREEAKRVSDNIANDKFYKSNIEKINVYAVETISQQSGVGVGPVDKPKEVVNNYFGTMFEYAEGVRRLIYTPNYGKVMDTAKNHVPSYDEVVILSNSTEYGGGGGSFAVLSINTNAPDVLLHEVGHSFGNLADEYWYRPNTSKYNMDSTNDPTNVKWKKFLNYKNIGIYQHSDYYGKYPYYKPSEDVCKMEILGAEFCAVCINAQLKELNIAVSKDGKDKVRPTIPEEVKADDIKSTEVKLLWEKSIDNEDIKEYEIYSNDKLVATTSTESCIVKNLSSGSKYNFYIKAKDTSNNLSYASKNIEVKTPGMEPAIVKITNYTEAAKGYTLDFIASQADNRELGWEIYENGNKIRWSKMYATKIEQSIPFMNMADGTYEYKVVVYDRNGNRSESDIVKVSIGNNIQQWKSGVYYKIGDKVMYNGKSYECTYTHTSLIGWEPGSQAAALWKAIK